jgi:acyl-CoA hydrolase
MKNARSEKALTTHPQWDHRTFEMMACERRRAPQNWKSLHASVAVEVYPVDYVNNPFVIAQNDRVGSANATLQIDLNGACNSEFMNGRQFNAFGGWVDFVRGAYTSRGRSTITCHSTAGKGILSCIVPALTDRSQHRATHISLLVWMGEPKGQVRGRASNGADRAGLP